MTEARQGSVTRPAVGISMVTAIFSSALLLQACSDRPSAASAQEHVRGAIQGVNGDVLEITTASGPSRVQISAATTIVGIVPADRKQLTAGSYLGITSVPEPDGSERAVEVHIFPDSMRGTGEGSRDWDHPSAGGRKMTNGTATSSKMTNGTVAGASKMTNGTVAASKMTNGTVAADASGSLTLDYRSGGASGSRTIVIPEGIPVVALEPGQRSDLQPGTHVFVVAHRDAGGNLIADRIEAGRNGLVPPM